ncbi:MAG TPA: glycogen-binding domain-containing protein [Kofleriaceae bacterium]
MTSRSCLLAPILAIALAACGGGATTAGPTTTAPPPPPSEPVPAAATTPETPAAPAAPARQMAPGPNLTADGVVFVFKPEGGGKKKVFLAGNFNDWKPDNPQYLMTADATGAYTITVKLPPGTYQYKFVADGQWIKDPFSPGDAPDGFGGRNGKFDVK